MKLRTYALVGGFGLAGIAAASMQDAQRPSEFQTGIAALERGDYAIAYCHWLPLADRGYAEAQYHIGWLYANGNGLAVDVEKALSWWQRAARQGHADAQFAVGLAYTTGEGVGRDLEEAVGWYLAAARLGHADAREIILRLNGDPSLDLLESHPSLIDEVWFGWQGRIVRDRINVRGGPGTEHPVITQLDRDVQVRIVGQRGDWWQVVLTDGNHRKPAWIFKQLVKKADG
jgi:TPR repeat protein